MPNCSNQDFAIILAAGLSTRMGVCKTTLPWHNERTLLRYQAEQFQLAGITPIIVLGSHNAYRRADCPPGSQIAVNFNNRNSKTSSILTGLRLLPQKFSTITISAVDQPRPYYIYQTLLQSYKENKSLITAPCYRNNIGHPLLFSHQLKLKLNQINDSSLGLRKIIRESYNKIEKVHFLSSDILIDINDKKLYSSAIYQSKFGNARSQLATDK